MKRKLAKSLILLAAKILRDLDDNATGLDDLAAGCLEVVADALNQADSAQ